MKICIVGKFPPIQGGVSAQTYWAAHELAQRGHEVHVVTNAGEVEYGYRQLLLPSDVEQIESVYGAGVVRCHQTTPLQPNSFIPWANPFASKLFGLAVSVIEEYGCELILGWYFEPYGLIATLAGRMAGRPVLVRHAGSDIGRLAKHPDLAKSYRWLLEQSDGILTARSVCDLLVSLGARTDALIFPGISRLPRVFFETKKSLELDAYREVVGDWYRSLPISSEFSRELVALGEKSIDAGLPVIGIYGKVGESKGSYDLVAALRQLVQRGLKFTFLSVACGRAAPLERFYRSILEAPALAQQTLILPPLPPWQIPGLLKLCNIVCFLERNFPIAFHTPLIPREVLSSGACLVCSAEIAGKQVFRENLVDGKNFILVPDPRNRDDLVSRLEALICEPERSKVIGKHGQYLSEFWEGQLPGHTLADAVERFASTRR